MGSREEINVDAVESVTHKVKSSEIVRPDHAWNKRRFWYDTVEHDQAKDKWGWIEYGIEEFIGSQRMIAGVP